MDNLCKRCYHNYVCEQYNENRDLKRTKCAYKNSHFVDAANVIPVLHGRWVTHHWHNSDYCYNCSECGGEAMHREYQWARNGIYPICPNCGAKMDLEG